MTWHHLLRSLMVAGAATAIIALAAGARAEGGEPSILPIDEIRQGIPEVPVEAAEAPTDPKPAKAAPRSRSAAKRSKASKPALGSDLAPSAAPAEHAATLVEAVPEAPGEAGVSAVALAAPAPAIEVPADATIEVAGGEGASMLRSRRARSDAKDASRAAALRALVEHHAAEAGVPFHLAHAVIRIESRYSAGARNGPNVGLTQINTRTAQSLGYQGGTAGLFDPDTNLRYGLRYLARAYELAKGDTCGTILRYQAGLRAQSMTRAARSYCARVQTIIASAL